MTPTGSTDASAVPPPPQVPPGPCPSNAPTLVTDCGPGDRCELRAGHAGDHENGAMRWWKSAPNAEQWADLSGERDRLQARTLEHRRQRIAVLTLHHIAEDANVGGDVSVYCAGCGYVTDDINDDPCPTRRALGAEPAPAPAPEPMPGLRNHRGAPGLVTYTPPAPAPAPRGETP